MKKILILLLFAATGAEAQTVLTIPHDAKHTEGRLDTLRLTTRGATSNPFYGQTSGSVAHVQTWPTKGFLNPQYDCEPYETFTPWEVQSEGNAEKALHSHVWVYAEFEDVNASSGITNAVYCPCGCPETQNQARICETCFRHEWRVRRYGMRPKEKEKSKYLQILENLKN